MTTVMAALAGRFVDVVSAEDGMVHARKYDVCFESPAWPPVLEWCRFHGIDPYRVPAGSTIIRDAALRRITYTRIVVDDDGRPRVTENCELRTALVREQGEAPPLPFPPEVLALPHSVHFDLRFMHRTPEETP